MVKTKEYLIGKKVGRLTVIKKDDAIKARLNVEVKYFGEFAPQKHLYKQYGITMMV